MLQKGKRLWNGRRILKDGAYNMFFEKYQRAVEDKKSIININLDPVLPRHREKFSIPDRYLSSGDGNALLDFSFEIIENVSDYCCSVKPNVQYFLSDTKILEKLAKKIHKEGMIAVFDNKLSDIGSTNEIAIQWISEMGFDAFTFSPFAGNMEPTIETAHKKNLGVIVLTLMSNPEAELMANATVNGIPTYQYIAKEVKRTNADGCVVGLTGFVEADYIKAIQDNAGDDKVFLLQGIGPQGGSESDLEKVKFVKNPLVSLGREVIYSEDIKGSLKRYHNLLNKVKKL